MKSDACRNSRPLAHRLAGQFIKDSRGAEIAEAAAVLPLMFMILLGIFWFGQAFSLYGTITRAAQEGARAGAAPTCATCSTGQTSSQMALTATQNALTVANLNPLAAQAPNPTPSLNACQTGGSSGGPATCSNSNICVQSPVVLTNPTGGAGVCGVAVTFQYPFQFWLPFTSLNKQQIWMSASARVRLESR
jgi:Flp pilus assembly protein TadG